MRKAANRKAQQERGAGRDAGEKEDPAVRSLEENEPGEALAEEERKMKTNDAAESRRTARDTTCKGSPSDGAEKQRRSRKKPKTPDESLPSVTLPVPMLW